MPAASEDMSDSSPAKTAAQMTRARRQALAPGSSMFDPISNIKVKGKQSRRQIFKKKLIK